jgi:hypothetical protein
MRLPGNNKTRILVILAIPVFFWSFSKAVPPILSGINGIVYRQAALNTLGENGFLSVRGKGRKDYKPISNIRLPLSRRTDPRLDHDQFILRIMGVLEVKQTDLYWIGTDSDDGSWIWLNGKKIVDNGGLHGRTEGMYPVRLTKGIHFLELKLQNLTGDAYLDAFWVPPNGLRQPLPIRPHPFGRMISNGYVMSRLFFKIAEYWVFLFIPVLLFKYLFPAKT